MFEETGVTVVPGSRKATRTRPSTHMRILSLTSPFGADHRESLQILASTRGQAHRKREVVNVQDGRWSSILAKTGVSNSRPCEKMETQTMKQVDGSLVVVKMPAECCILTS